MGFRSAITTQRLLLRKIAITDAPFYCQLFNSEGWIRFIGDKHIKTVAEAKTQLSESYISSWDEHGYGAYTVFESATQKPVGTCGLYRRESLKHPDIGFAFLPEYTGKGYGFEASLSVLKVARQKLGLNKVLAVTLPENNKAIRLLEKLGLKVIETRYMGNSQTPMLLFSTCAPRIGPSF